VSNPNLLVYIVGPYRAPTPEGVQDNIRRAREWAAAVAEAGYMPVCPHALTVGMDRLQPDEFWLAGTLELMRRCDAVLLTPGWNRSAGSRSEATEARTLNLWIADAHNMDPSRMPAALLEALPFARAARLGPNPA